MHESDNFVKQEVREKIRQAALRNSASTSARMIADNPMKRPEVVAKRVAFLVGRKCPWMVGENSPTKRPEVREKMRIASLLARDEISNRVKMQWEDPKFRARMSGRNSATYGIRKFGKDNPHYGKKNTAESRKLMSIKAVKRIVDNGGVNPTVNKHKNGVFYSHKNKASIHYDSSYELAAFRILENDADVVSYGRCKFSIAYYDFDGNQRRYIPDILAVYLDGSKRIIEVKPEGLLQDSGNIAKFDAAERYCNEAIIEFSVWTQKELGL